MSDNQAPAPQREEELKEVAATTPKEAPPVPTNPDASPSKEPTGDKVGFVSIGANVAAFIAFSSLLLFVVATPIEWLSNVTVASTEEVSIWGTTFGSSTAGWSTPVADLGCPKQIKFFRAIEVFAIVSIFSASLFLLLAVLARKKIVALKTAAIGSVLSSIASLIAWSVAIALYNKTFPECGLNSYSGRQFNIGPGGALFVVGWVLSILGTFVCIRDISVPKIIPDALLNYFLAFIATIASAAAFIFAVIASPITILYVKDAAGTRTQVSSWDVKVFDINGVKNNSYTFQDVHCGGQGDTQNFSAAFSIVTIVFALAALIQSYRLLKTETSRARTTIVLFLAALVGLIKMAADISLYYRRFCDAYSLYSQAYKFGAGFALSTAAWVLLAVPAILLLVTSITQRCAKGKDTPAKSWPAYLLTFLALTSLTFFILGAALPVLTYEVATNIQKFYWWNWQFTFGTSSYMRSQDYSCTDLKNQMLAGGSLDIVAIAFTALGSVLALGQFFSADLRKPAAVLVLAGSVPALISWALGVAVYWGNFCGVTPYNSSYRIAAGLSLIIAGWGASLIGGLIAIFVQ